MVSLALWVLAGVLGSLSILALGGLTRASTVDGRVLGEEVARLLVADERPRAVELCSVAPHAAASALALFMLSLELPTIMVDPAAPGYRGEPRKVSFDDHLQSLVDGEAQRMRHRSRTLAFTAIMASSLAAVACGAVLLSPTPHRLAFAVVSAIATLFIVVAVWRLAVTLDALGAAHAILLPRLQPIEQMSDADLRAAPRARELVAPALL